MKNGRTAPKDVRGRKRFLYECPIHGTQPAYAVCRHISANGDLVLNMIPPGNSPSGVGVIRCGRKEPHTAEELSLTCERCAAGKGWLGKTPVLEA